MHSGVTFLGRGSNYYRRAFLSAALIALCSTLSVSALGTSVQTTVDNGDTHPSLTLDKPASPVTAKSMPLQVSGTLKSLTQIQVYVDDALSVTIPLDAGASSFSSSIVVPSGAHEVKLVGISPFADVSPTVALAVTYETPSAQDTGGPTAGSPSSNDEAVGGIIIGPNGSTSTSTTYTPTTHTSSLPGWLYEGLLTLDLTTPGDVDGKETIKNIERFSLATTGTFFLAFSRPTLLLYRKARYAWLGIKKKPTLSFTSGHPIAIIRTIGTFLVSSALYFI